MSEEQTAQSAHDSHIVLRLFNALDRGLRALELLVVGGSILLMAAVMTAHVGGRTFFGQGVAGAFEITENIIIVLTFVGTSYAVREARHISMSALYDQLAGRARKTALVVISIGTGALMFYLAWLSLGYVIEIYERGRTTPALQMKLWMIYSALPIGFLLAGIQYWLTALRNLTTEGIWRSFGELEAYSDIPDDETDTAAEDAGETRGHL